LGYVQLQDQEIFYEIDGVGPPVLMVMGLGGNSQVWAPLRRALSSNYTLIMYDMRGTGRSSQASSPATLDDLIEEIHAVLVHLELRDVRAVGFSFGATVLLNYAYRYPQLLKSVSLVSGAYEFTTYVRKFIDVQVELASVLPRSQYLKQVMLWLLSERFFQHNPEFFDRAIFMLERSPLAGRFLEIWQLFALAFQDSYQGLATLPMPLQFVHGSADKVSSPEIVQRITTDLTNCQVDWVEYGGHMLTWDAPEQTIDLLCRFWNKQSAKV